VLQAECVHDNQEESQLRSEDEDNLGAATAADVPIVSIAPTAAQTEPAEKMTSRRNLAGFPCAEIDINRTSEAELNVDFAGLMTSSHDKDQSNRSPIGRRRLPDCPSPVSMATPMNSAHVQAPNTIAAPDTNVLLKAVQVSSLPTNERVSSYAGNSGHVSYSNVFVTSTTSNRDVTRSQINHIEQQSINRVDFITGGQHVTIATTASVGDGRRSSSSLVVDRAIITQPKKVGLTCDHCLR